MFDKYSYYYDNEEFARRLSDLIYSTHNSRKEFCWKLGISIQSLNNYLRGERIPHTEVVIRMAEYFNTSTDYLLLGKKLSNAQATVDAFGMTGLSIEQIALLNNIIQEFKKGNAYADSSSKKNFKICQNCGNIVQDEYRYCPYCGRAT